MKARTMKNLTKHTLYALLAGLALTQPLYAAEGGGGGTIDNIDMTATLRSSIATRLANLQASATTLTATVNNLAGTVNNYDSDLTTLDLDLNGGSGILSKKIPDAREAIRLINVCAQSHQADCLPNLKITEDVTGRNPDGTKISGAKCISGNCASTNNKKGTERWEFDIPVTSYPFCTFIGGEEWAWKKIRLIEGDPNWEVDIEIQDLLQDGDTASVRVRCIGLQAD